ncbi:hypothetical protein AB1Y20_005791 [Prymnesium parvum]|uniref:Uncharacterized protein n=1 Tax=Prymnesium parvum TaxID=97485 RepID=A0AB34J314_PRYPA
MTTSTTTTTTTTTTMQATLGDAVDEEIAKRRAAVTEKMLDILGRLGPDGPTKPKHAQMFFKNIQFKATGGQQLTATCMFCDLGPIASTGASRLVHYLNNCSACPPIVKCSFQGMTNESQKKRKAKDEATKLAEEEAELARRKEKVRSYHVACQISCVKFK